MRLWTDSQCVLHWLNEKKPLSVFVENRMKEIRKQKNLDFSYVPTKENPADIGTRGISPDDFKTSIWFSGPLWLSKNENEWPKWKYNYSAETADVIKESRGPKNFYSVSNFGVEDSKGEVDPQPFGLNENTFSTLTRLLRLTAWVLRFIRKLQKRSLAIGSLTTSEMKDAKELWELFIQRKCFRSTIYAIQSKKHDELGVQLGLELDGRRLLRAHGRLTQMNETHDTIFPKLLPRKEYFTFLVIKDCHERLMHSGVAHTLSQIRHQYWIPSGRREVQKVIRECRRCRKALGGPYLMPKMPSWPTSRMLSSAPFSFTGLDYLGPLYIKDNEKISKCWVCLFTCLAVRAIHLELIHDLSAEEFLQCLRRFIARRGKPVEIISDNAPQFKVAKTLLDRLWFQALSDVSVQSYISKEGINWKFIVQLAPWMGGFYERLVGLVKLALRKSLSRSCLTATQLYTILTEVEAVLNSRPLVYVGSDIESGLSLTPSHFLLVNPKTGVPVLDTESDPEYLQKITLKENLITKWRNLQTYLHHFWKTWSGEYLLSLRERYQSNLKKNRPSFKMTPHIGDVVLIKEDLPRGSWRLGKIVELISGSDKQVRSAKVRLPSKTVLHRALNQLCPLECSSGETTEHEEESVIQPKVRILPLRHAAMKAKESLHKYFDSSE